MKTYKLQIHQSNFCAEDLIVNPKDFPNINIGDVVEIYHPQDEHSRLLLQVVCLKEDFLSKDTVSVEYTIASSFHLRNYSDVYVNVVNPKDVSLDSVELTFKDQYLARSDMWRLKQSINNTCVYVNKTVKFAGIRSQVYEMWSQGERVASGVVTHDTKVVFRSSTSMVYLFVQMSSEMWDFDINGDLYFEKAVYGFLSDLFAKWKKHGCNHDVTVVLFSRTFYKASSIEEFPEHMRECLQQDYKGRFYEDFYRVAIQNERYDDWCSILVELKRLFYQYTQTVLEYHSRPGVQIPQAYNSAAAQGNFLEVLNMSLNVFERHYIDRSLDRTGQLSVVITPGVGVFEVDRELANVTKQRIIDSGIGSDLVCLGEQPLHAVPLFKFQSKHECYSVVDDYNMPHWINLSFYSSTNKRLSYSNFVPRMKAPSNISNNSGKAPHTNVNKVYSSKRHSSHDDTFHSLFDYDAYDAEVFKYSGNVQNTAQQFRSLQMVPQHKKSSVSLHKPSIPASMMWRKMSEDKTTSGVLLMNNGEDLPSPGFSSPSLTSSRSSAINIPTRSDGTSLSSSYDVILSNSSKKSPMVRQHSTTTTRDDSDTEPSKSPRMDATRLIAGSVDTGGLFFMNEPRSRHNSSNVRHSRALFNPFDPSHLTIKLTSNRRRWTHVFPIGPKGGFMQEHHRKMQPEKYDEEKSTMETMLDETPTSPRLEVQTAKVRKQKTSSSSTLERNKDKNKQTNHLHEYAPSSLPTTYSAAFSPVFEGRFNKIRGSLFKATGGETPTDNSLLLVWGATGEQEWSPSLTTGVDWKSLTRPACLPITTDYFPDNRSLQNYYVVSDYCLHPDDISSDIPPIRVYKVDGESKQQTMSTDELFKELVLQRLQQSFQIILIPKSQKANFGQIQVSSSPQYAPTLVRSRSRQEFGEEYLLSIGRIFHKLTLIGPMITVTQFRPRHPYPQIKVHYRYRFQAPDNFDYGVSWVHFTTELLENYGWNYLDHYICMKGEGDFTLKDTFKYWRINLGVLPSLSSTTRKIIDGVVNRCDIYPAITNEEQSQFRDGFIKLIEILNKIKPTINCHKQKARVSRKPSCMNFQHPVASSIPAQKNLGQSQFRDRVSSNSVHDRPRSMSGAKTRERLRSESGNFNSSQVTCPVADLLLNTGDSTRSLSSNDSIVDVQSSSSDLIECAVEQKLLLLSSSLSEIAEAMKHPDHGLEFLSRHPGLPQWSFISFEAVTWLCTNRAGIASEDQALRLLEEMKDNNLLRHASGIRNHPVLNGFYIYFLNSNENEAKNADEFDEQVLDIEDFQKEWFEVEILSNKIDDGSEEFNFLLPSDTLQSDEKATMYDREMRSYRKHTIGGLRDPLYKCTTLELDSADCNRDGPRSEWGHALYHGVYKSTQAFEIVIQWMVATGSILSELLSMWQRKATTNHLHLVPIPSDPFALPFSGKSDPLRGPVFVPLEIECLSRNDKQHLFHDFKKCEHDRRLFLFQEAIARKFGFIPMQCELQQRVGGLQYIHLSGGMFVMITRKTNSGASAPGDDFRVQRVEPVYGNRMKVEVHQLSNPHEEYITRHVTTRSSNPTNPSNKVGFLWSWNHMLSKRWRSTATGETYFQDKILSDFRAFCTNKDHRLEQFWDSCMERYITYLHNDLQEN